MKKNTRMALGRGLSALVSSAAPVAAVNDRETISNTDLPIKSVSIQGPQDGGAGVTYLAISQIIANPNQPRQEFSEQEINELSESIKELGVLQPILVRPYAGGYQIVAGERRFRAANRAGMAQIPVIIRDLDERETLEIALVENIQRQSLNPIEEAKSYQRLIEDFSLSVQEVAERVGKDRATVANTARILKLPPAVQDMVRDGRLSLGHAKAILTVKEPGVQLSLANKIIAESLSVRAIEAIVAREVVLDVSKRGAAGEGAQTLTTARISAYPELEERLRNALGTKVSIRKGRKGGAIELHYFSDAELDRLVQILTTSRE